MSSAENFTQSAKRLGEWGDNWNKIVLPPFWKVSLF